MDKNIFLYDNVSGGAGLVRRIGTENVGKILNSTFDRLGGRECENGGCDRVCMNCLLDFRNQMEQDLLNRPLGFQLINNFRYDTIPEYEHTSIDSQKNYSKRRIQQLNTILSSSFQNFEIDVNEENLVISGNGKTRNIYPHSILRGVQTLPEGHINYRKLESIEVDEDSIITVPFELLNNSPHIVFEIMTAEITSNEDEDSSAWF